MIKRYSKDDVLGILDSECGNAPAVSKLDYIQSKTLKEAELLLSTVGRCMVVRPTGFGKTYLSSKFVTYDRRILFVYPTNVLKADVLQKYPEFNTNRVTMMSYIMFGKLHEMDFQEYFEESKFDLMIFDEVHCAGAYNVIKTFEVLEHTGIIPSIPIVGLTATPNRLDGFSVLSEIFKGAKVFKYDYKDAVADGILNKPMYVLCVANIVQSVNDYANFKGIDNKFTRQARQEIEGLALEMANKVNAPQVLQGNIIKCYGSTPSYMKFIVYFSRICLVESEEVTVKEWFLQAFEGKKVRITTVTSRSEDREGIQELQNLEYVENTIDLIMTVDMLNMGYHINNLNGIIMLRSTGSPTVFPQQVGRCISANSDMDTIIFDFMGNLNKAPFYEIKIKEYDAEVARKYSEGSDEKDYVIGADDVILIDTIADYRDQINQKMEFALRKTEHKILWELRVNNGLSAEICKKVCNSSLDIVEIEKLFLKWGI